VSHVHDQMAGPRVTVAWGHPDPTVVPVAANVSGDVADIAAVIRRQFHDVVTGVIPAEPPLLPNVDPVEWRGVGPYGHGGAGMTGGTPYGRPLPVRADDPDGLKLDSLPVTVGPWFPGFPPGLALRVSLYGDVAREVGVVTTNLVSAGPAGVFVRALHEPVPIRDLEMARARHHLEWMADTLLIAGVDRLARQAGRVAAAIGPGEVGSVEKLMVAARRSLLGPMSFRGVGVLPQEFDLSGLGPAARAAGVDDDRRASEPAYRDMGFRSLTHHTGDAWARFEQRGAEAAQAVDLASRAGDGRAFGNGEVEGPDGLHRLGGPAPAEGLLAMLETVLDGMEWGDLVTTVQSLDIDMESVSVGRPTA
ncbi:MAG: hypothetical protein ACC660_04180, partial [Acidimicrobiales bacterium]